MDFFLIEKLAWRKIVSRFSFTAKIGRNMFCYNIYILEELNKICGGGRSLPNWNE